MSSNKSQLDIKQFVTNLWNLQYREIVMVFATLAVVTGSIVLFPGAENVTKGLQSEVSGPLFVLFVTVAIIAGAVKGMIGFGYALTTTPIFVSVIDPTLAIVVLTIPPWMLNMFQIGETDTGLAFVREEWPLIGLAVVGSIIGVLFLEKFRTGPLLLFLIGIVIFAYVVFQLVKNALTIQEAHHPVALSTAGFLEGFLLAAANLGPILPAYLHTFERDMERYIGGLSMVLVMIFTVRIVQMTVFSDLMTIYRLWFGSVIAVVTIFGLLLGTYLRRLKIDEERFNWFVIALLFVVTFHIFWKTIPTLFF